MLKDWLLKRKDAFSQRAIKYGLPSPKWLLIIGIPGTGAEIEQTFIDALYAAFAESKEPTDLTVSMVLNDLVPLSKLMAEQITALRQWAEGRARLATSQEEGKRGRKIAA